MGSTRGWCRNARCRHVAALVSTLLLIVVAAPAARADGGLLRLSTGTLDFGQVVVGTTSAPRSVALVNDGLLPITLVDFVAETDTSAFRVSAGTCEDVLLGPGASCAVDFRYQPRTEGAHTGTGTVSARLRGRDLVTLEVTLDGTAIEPAEPPPPEPDPTEEPPPEPDPTEDPAPSEEPEPRTPTPDPDDEPRSPDPSTSDPGSPGPEGTDPDSGNETNGDRGAEYPTAQGSTDQPDDGHDANQHGWTTHQSSPEGPDSLAEGGAANARVPDHSTGATGAPSGRTEDVLSPVGTVGDTTTADTAPDQPDWVAAEEGDAASGSEPVASWRGQRAGDRLALDHPGRSLVEIVLFVLLVVVSLSYMATLGHVWMRRRASAAE